MINQIFNLLSPAYLLNKSLGPFQSNLVYIFVVFNILLVLLAVILRRLAKDKDLFIRKASQKYEIFAWTMAPVGIILYIFRQINVFYLSAPIILLIWAIVLIIWLVLVLKYRFIIVPKRRKDLMQEKEKRNYIP